MVTRKVELHYVWIICIGIKRRIDLHIIDEEMKVGSKRLSGEEKLRSRKEAKGSGEARVLEHLSTMKREGRINRRY